MDDQRVIHGFADDNNRDMNCFNQKQTVDTFTTFFL